MPPEKKKIRFKSKRSFTKSAKGPSPKPDLQTELEKKPFVKVLSYSKVSPKQYLVKTQLLPGREFTQAGMVHPGYQAALEFVQSDILATSTVYRPMPFGYRNWRRDALVRLCVNLRAAWATKAGFDTVVEPIKEVSKEEAANIASKYKDLKSFIDYCNRKVNMDRICRNILTTRRLYGKCGYTIIRDANNPWKINAPKRLIPFQKPNELDPLINEETWEFVGVGYKGKGTVDEPTVKAVDLLYFAKDDLFDDKEGVSDVEPILDALTSRYRILAVDIPEAVHTSWAGVVYWQVDIDTLPAGTTEGDVQTLITNHLESIVPGRHLGSTTQWKITQVPVNPNLDQLMNVKKELDREVISIFEVPRFLVGREEQVNRATARPIIEAFLNGPVMEDQHELRRELEAQWYTPLVKAFLKTEEPEVRVTHKWRTLRVTDLIDLIRASAYAYDGGEGFFTKKEIFELLRDGTALQLKPDEVEEPAQIVTEQQPSTKEPVETKQEQAEGRFVTRTDGDGAPYRFFLRSRAKTRQASDLDH